MYLLDLLVSSVVDVDNVLRYVPGHHNIRKVGLFDVVVSLLSDGTRTRKELEKDKNKNTR